jgi:uridine kinase
MRMFLFLMLQLVIYFLILYIISKLFHLATGAAALMAIRVLLDHSVPEDKIALLSLLVSKQGLYLSIN